ncbi:MAG TPA: hypothetical protein VJ872_15525 [Nocardioides sp.]|nr:hypothetical protein [Nocardioides sp.]
MRALLSLASVAAAATLLAGCGSGGATATDPASIGTTAASSTPTKPAAPAMKLPACASIWKVGATLPAHYKGCQVNGAKGKSLVYHCEIGSQIASYGTDLYAIVGRKVTQASPSLQADSDWQYLYSHCVG